MLKNILKNNLCEVLYKVLKQAIQEYWKKASTAVTSVTSNNISLIKKISIVAIVILLIFTSIFGVYNYVSMNRSVSQLKLELESLTANFNKLKDNTQTQSLDMKDYSEFKMKALTDIAITKLMLEQFNKAVFNVADSGKGFARVDTSTGMFFLILDKSEQVGEGYKLNFRLGNPQNCVYNGCKLKVRWGKKYDREDKSISYEDWEKTLGNAEHSISSILRPGEWSNFDITISPAKTEDTQYIEIKIQTDQIIMQKSSTN